jgi:hypothetical protein
MTEEQKQEMISREFLKILAHAHGFKVIEPLHDHGVDLTICPVTQRVDPNGHMRFLDSQFKLDFQLKSTTPAGIILDENTVRYDLSAKTYNDLVHRKNDLLPLHLVLVVLSGVPPTCVDLDEQRLSLIGQAYWYLPEDDATPTENANEKRITIPRANVLIGGFVQSCYDRLEIEL